MGCGERKCELRPPLFSAVRCGIILVRNFHPEAGHGAITNFGVDHDRRHRRRRHRASGAVRRSDSQVEQAISRARMRSAPGGAGEPDAAQSVGAQLHHQPTPGSVQSAERVAIADGDAALERARKADTAGDGAACTGALAEAKAIYGVESVWSAIALGSISIGAPAFSSFGKTDVRALGSSPRWFPRASNTPVQYRSDRRCGRGPWFLEQVLRRIIPRSRRSSRISR